MSDIKTVTLDGGELKVEGLNGQNTIIVNRGAATLYVSIDPDIVPDGDNVAAIPTGGAMNLHGTNGTVYLLGTGKVQLTGTDDSWLPISSGGSSGGGGSTGGGVSQEYVDNGDALTLNAAKKYTDDKIDEVSEAIPTIPDSLPANGGNAETAERLAAPITINGVEFDGSKNIEIDAVTQNTYNCNFSTSLSKLLIEISMAEGLTSASYNVIIDGLSERARTDGNASYFQIMIDTTGLSSNAWDVKCMTTDASKLPAFKYTIDLESRILRLYVKSAYTVFDFNYRIAIQSTRNVTTKQNIIKNLDVDEIPDTAIDVPVEQYAFLSEVQNLQSEIAELKGYIGYTDSDIYGLEADFENNKFTRLAGAVGKNPGADFDSINAFGGRRRCALTNNGTVISYYGDTDWQEPDGRDENISQNVQCMVEQPKFYYKVVPLKTEKIDGADGYHLRKARYYISDTPKPGFKIHPAFIQNGVEVDLIYLSAYEGAIQSVSNISILQNDEQIANFDVDKFCSIANVKPASGTTQALTRDNARKLAQNRGDGWGITTVQTLSATQMLFVIEYATFNSQTAIGSGISTKSSGSGNESEKTSATSSLGNTSGSVESGAVSYRGEENLWGNIMYFVADCNIDVDNSNYLQASIDKNVLPISKTTNKYMSAFSYNSFVDWGFLPSECLGNSSLPIGDISYAVPADANTNEVVFCAGGDWYHGGANGLYATYMQWSMNTHARMCGARLIYIPQTQEVTAND